jgi:hypothetical protein
MGQPEAHEAEHLLEEARPPRSGKPVAAHDDGVVHFCGDRQVEPRAELDRAEDAHGILAKADYRIANRADDAVLDVRHPADPVENRMPLDVVEEGVNGKIAAIRILICVAKNVVAANEEIVPIPIYLRRPAERGRLDDFAAPEQHVHKTESPTDDARVSEEAPHVVGPRASCDVEVLGSSAEEEIPNGAADEVPLEVVANQATDHLLGVRVDATIVQLERIDRGRRRSVTPFFAVPTVVVARGELLRHPRVPGDPARGRFGARPRAALRGTSEGRSSGGSRARLIRSARRNPGKGLALLRGSGGPGRGSRGTAHLAGRRRTREAGTPGIWRSFVHSSPFHEPCRQNGRA